MKSAPIFEDANKEILIETVLQNKPDISFTMTKDTAEYLEKNGLAVVFLSWSEVDDVKKAVKRYASVKKRATKALD
jgi:iron complex transport system substrate-binding protein